MGLFSSSSPPPTPQPQPSHATPTPSADGAFEAPDRTSRARCWEARDGFFACLERHGIVDAKKEKEKAEQVCGVEGRWFERECAPSWVTYFKDRRVMEYKKAKTMERLAQEGAN